MSSNQEFPKPENQLVKDPHAGGEGVPDDVREVPQREFKETPLLDAAKEELFVIPNTYEEGFKHTPFSEEEHARINRTPEKKSKKGIIAGIAGLALAAGVAIGLNAGAKEDNTPPPTPTETSAAANPAQTQRPEITPTPTQTTETAPTIDTAALKFYNTEGDSYQTYEDLVKSAELTVADNPDQTKVFGTFIQRVEDIANYVPTIKTVRESLNKPTEDLTMDDFLLVAEQYRVAHDGMFSSESGQLYDFSKALIQHSAAARFQSLNASDEVPYAVTLTLHTNGLGLLVADNSIHNSTDDNAAPQLGDYTLISSGGNDITSKNGSWKIGADIGVVEKPNS